MFAVVKIGSSQYLVTTGQELLVDYQGKDASKMTIKDVLMVADGESVQIGKPTLDVNVEAEVTGVIKGEKVRSAKYKAKSRYRKVRGFRALHTRIKITKIGGTESESAPEEKTKKVVRKAKVEKKS